MLGGVAVYPLNNNNNNNNNNNKHAKMKDSMPR